MYIMFELKKYIQRSYLSCYILSFISFMSLKFTEELCVMTMQNDAKFEEELTCHFKTDIWNLTNFDQALENLKKMLFNWLL